ncbi:MAG: aminotransferase class V-fold PLP-dependent enzyme [Gemmatimonadota bacterium]|nr:aminotransferase class V-fold PLP-dependent enzyme [Gemmatimonadota bacterium]MDE3007161.1 aminotransferase class V-fold PLP-dependent enzyme [Gemmatimonadota bacterium]MDE3012767.1 aminotransferase class V-fold PLP-dependent enzyme [Gemmatimonadota bacterium]
MAVDRRRFLTVLGSASLAWPRAVAALERDLHDGGEPDDELFWSVIRGQFLIPDERIYLNNGTLGPSPRVVVDAVTEHTRRVAQTYPPGVAWNDLKRSLSGLLGGDPEGFIFPRNTTEAMNFIANGVEVGYGDAVLSTDHEHIGGLEPWKLVTTRRGARLDIVSLPSTPRSADELVQSVWGGVTPETRVICVSHMTFTTGTVLPIPELASRCAEKGMVLAVDGAHPPGMLDVDLDVVGGDMYASSPHKWLLAPQGTGLLYISDVWRERLWPTLASGGWDDLTLGAHRLNHLGTFDESRLAGLLAAVEWAGAIRMPRIEARIRYLRDMLEAGLRTIPGLHVVGAQQEEQKGGMVSFSLDGVESSQLQQHLSRAENVRTRVIGEYDYGWMRLSTHVYNSPEQITRVLELVDDVARNGLPA